MQQCLFSLSLKSCQKKNSICTITDISYGSENCQTETELRREGHLKLAQRGGFDSVLENEVRPQLARPAYTAKQYTG
jgi:hypothetical protein